MIAKIVDTVKGTAGYFKGIPQNSKKIREKIEFRDKGHSHMLMFADALADENHETVSERNSFKRHPMGKSPGRIGMSPFSSLLRLPDRVKNRKKVRFPPAVEQRPIDKE